MVGIYKITSPSGRVYVGQSINIERRFARYKYYSGGQVRLVASFKKYLVESHTFIILEECQIDQLNDRERYWQDAYDVLGCNGLNCKLTNTEDKSGVLSEEVKLKKSQAMKGRTRVLTPEHKENIRLARLGTKRSEETKEKLREIKLGKVTRPHSEVTKQKISNTNKGHKMSQESINKRTEARKDYRMSQESKDKMLETRRLNKLKKSC